MRARLYQLNRTFRSYPELIVVSGGGNGTTQLIRHLSQYRETNAAGDGDGLKHSLEPPHRALRAGSRVIFIRGEISRQISSLERRGTLRFQAFKLDGIRTILCKASGLKPRLTYLIARQSDLFLALRNQNVLILEYPDYFHDPERIAKWAGIDDPQFVTDFPPYRPPHSPLPRG